MSRLDAQKMAFESAVESDGENVNYKGENFLALVNRSVTYFTGEGERKNDLVVISMPHCAEEPIRDSIITSVETGERWKIFANPVDNGVFYKCECHDA